MEKKQQAAKNKIKIRKEGKKSKEMSRKRRQFFHPYK